MFKKIKISNLRKYVIVLGIIVAASINAIATKIFIVPAGLLPAGTSSVALGGQKIIKFYTHMEISYYYLFFLINLPLIIWIWNKLDSKIIYKTLLHVVVFTIVSIFLPKNMMVTNNILINSISGGIFFGLANCILLYFGSSATGLDLIGLYINKKKNLNIMGRFNFIFNLCIYIIYVPFSSYEKAFLSLTASLVTGLITDKFHFNSSFVLLLIVTKKPNIINQYITTKTKRSDILIDSVGGYSQVPSKTIISVVSKHKFKQTIGDLKNLDPNIYLVVLPTEKIVGKMNSMVGKSNI